MPGVQRGRDRQICGAQGIFRAVKLSIGKAGYKRKSKKISFTCAGQNYLTEIKNYPKKA